MKYRLFVAIAFVGAMLLPPLAQACDGPAGSIVALTTDGSKYTVTNMGRVPVVVTFTGWGQTYTLSLAAGQSAVPVSSGIFRTPMQGYQTCTAIPMASP